MAGIARELEVTYGSFTVGGASTALLDAQLLTDRDFLRGAVEFTALVRGDDAEEFAEAVEAIEAAFREPYQDLEVTLGDEVLLTAKPSANTGLDTMPRIVCREDDGNTGRSRVYKVRVEYGLPADAGTPAAGLRDSRVGVEYDPSRRRTVTVRGTFTALDGNDAREQYEAAIEAYCTAVLTTLGGTYDLVREDTAATVNVKTLDFSRRFREIIFPEGNAALDDPDITEQSLVVSRRLSGAERSPTTIVQAVSSRPGETSDRQSRIGSGRVTPLVVMDAVYTATIDADATRDLEGKWEAIRDHVLELVASVYRGSAMAVMSERPSFNFDDNSLAVAIEALGPDPAGDAVFEQTLEIENSNELGKVIVPAWGGTPYTAAVFPGPGTRTRRTTFSQKYVESGNTGHLDFGMAGPGSGPGPGGGMSVGGMGVFISGGFERSGNSVLFGNSGDAVFGDPNEGTVQRPNPPPGAALEAGWILMSQREVKRPSTYGREQFSFAVTSLMRTWVEQRVDPVPPPAESGPVTR